MYRNQFVEPLDGAIVGGKLGEILMGTCGSPFSIFAEIWPIGHILKIL